MLSKTRLSALVGVVFSALTLVGAMLLLLSAPSGASAATPIFDFTKTIDKTSVHSGNILTVTLSISPTAALTETRQFTITDPIQNTNLWEVLSTTVSSGASYSPTINAVVWLGTASPNTIATVTFQMHIKSVGTIRVPTVVTNTAYVRIYDPLGSLAGSLPGSLVTDIGFGNLGAQAPVTLVPYLTYLPIVRK